MAAQPESMIYVAASCIAIGIVGGAAKALPAVPDTKQALILAGASLAAAYAANRAARFGRGVILRSLHPFALGLLGALGLALVVAGMMVMIALEARGVAQVLCWVGAALPPVAAWAGWRTAGHSPETTS